MKKVFALIKNNLVINTIVIEDETFLATLFQMGVHDKAVRIDGCEMKPGIGWTQETLENADRFTNGNLYVVVANNEALQFGEIEESEEE